MATLAKANTLYNHIIGSFVAFGFACACCLYDFVTVGHLREFSAIALPVSSVLVVFSGMVILILHIQSSPKRNGMKVEADIVAIETHGDTLYPMYKIIVSNPTEPGKTYSSEMVIGSSIGLQEYMANKDELKLANLKIDLYMVNGGRYFVDTKKYERYEDAFLAEVKKYKG